MRHFCYSKKYIARGLL
jgi:rRNA biogenesis protein RRP5